MCQLSLFLNVSIYFGAENLLRVMSCDGMQKTWQQFRRKIKFVKSSINGSEPGTKNAQYSFKSQLQNMIKMRSQKLSLAKYHVEIWFWALPGSK